MYWANSVQNFVCMTLGSTAFIDIQSRGMCPLGVPQGGEKKGKLGQTSKHFFSKTKMTTLQLNCWNDTHWFRWPLRPFGPLVINKTDIIKNIIENIIENKLARQLYDLKLTLFKICDSSLRVYVGIILVKCNDSDSFNCKFYVWYTNIFKLHLQLFTTLITRNETLGQPYSFPIF